MHDTNNQCTDIKSCNLKYIGLTNNLHDVDLRQKNFMHGLQNARNILSSLEKSLRKTNKYEDKLLKCRSKHSHSHFCNEWWESESFGDKSKSSKASKSENIRKSRSQVDLTESWSTMSIVCLQYQYEELSKRYSTLLQAYDERSKALSRREAAIARLTLRARRMHARLAFAHKTLLNIGEKYLALRAKGQAQKSQYKAKIAYLERCVSDVVNAAERARIELDSLIARSLLLERDTESALLLAEIRKCNMLYLENLRLKAKLEKLAPGTVKWSVE